ncbi:MAG: glycerol-3-phosphate 1-O-acyltransferase PlsY [Chloroflexota bacterium]
MTPLMFVAAVIAAYLLGSIPFGLIVGRLKSGIDIRQQGSGKTGATNVMRSVGRKYGVLTIVLDVAKAAGAVLLAKVIVSSDAVVAGVATQRELAQVLAGFAAIAGHNWPVFAGFRGGRGVAAAFGTLLAIYPPAGILGVEVLAIAALVSRHMSLGSMLGMVAVVGLLVPLTTFYGFPVIFFVYCILVAGLVVLQHRDNIRRLRQGVERKLW